MQHQASDPAGNGGDLIVMAAPKYEPLGRGFLEPIAFVSEIPARILEFRLKEASDIIAP